MYVPIFNRCSDESTPCPKWKYKKILVRDVAHSLKFTVSIYSRRWANLNHTQTIKCTVNMAFKVSFIQFLWI